MSLNSINSMIVPIDDVIASYKFGTADSVRIKMIDDNLTNSAVFSWELGKNNPNAFVEAPYSSGHLTMDLTEYSQWDGTNEQAKTFVLSKLGLTLKV